MISVNSWIRTPPKAEYIKEHYNQEKHKYFYSFFYSEKEDKGNNNYIYNSYLIYVCTNVKPLPNQLLSVDSISGVGRNTYTSKKSGKTYSNVVMFICAKEVDVRKNAEEKKKTKNSKNTSKNNDHNKNRINSDYSSIEISNELDDIPF